MNQPIGIRELAEQAKRDGAYDLAQGVIDAAPPSILLENLKKLPLEHYSTYNNKRGVLEYREAIQHYVLSRNWTVPIEQIMAVAGAMGGITAALLNNCRPGDTVLLPEPFYVYHKLLLKILGFKVKLLDIPLDQQPNWDDIEQQMSLAQAFILTTPANPTGQVTPVPSLQKLSEAAEKYNCLLILDEMYREFIWENAPTDDSAYQNLNLQNTVIVRSFSKTYCIPGWRVGFVITSPQRVEEMATLHDALYIGGSTIAQYALAETLKNNLAELNHYVVKLREQLQDNMKILAEAFRTYGMDPLPVPATYYMLLKHNRASDLKALEELIQKKVVVTPLNILYANSDKDTGFIRIHFALSPDKVTKVRDILKGL